jgi:hypothetical protein
VSVCELRGCHTQGRTVEEARRRSSTDDARGARIVDAIKLPTSASKAIRVHAALRKRADRGDRRAAMAARRAVRLLRGGRLKMSARDAARLHELSGF